MGSDSEKGIERLWREQREEEHIMSDGEIRERARRFKTKTSQWNSVGFLLMVFLVADSSLEIWRSDNLLVRAGNAGMLAAVCYVTYRYRKYRMNAPPAALGQTSCLEFYRSELIRQRNLSQDGWGYVLPFAPGFCLIILGRVPDRSIGDVAVLTTLAAGVFVVIAWMNARAVRKLQKEIDAIAKNMSA